MFKQLIRLWKQHPKSNNLRLEYRKQNTSFRITSNHFNAKKTPGKSIKLCFKCFKKKVPTFAGVSFPLKCLKSKWPNLRRWSDLSLWPQRPKLGKLEWRWRHVGRKSLETTNTVNTYRYKLSFKLSLIKGGKKKCVQNHSLETVTLRQKKMATWHVARKQASLKSEMSIINDLGMKSALISNL